LPSYSKGQPGIFQAALSGLCPRCHAKTLFEAPARVALKCTACELALGALERGGRLSGVFTALVAIVIMLLAMGLDAALRPPLWLHAVIWVPVTLIGVIGGLRLFKAALLYANYEACSDDPDAIKETPSE
jgi:uncharacterized protein (DUF983 family)